MAIIGCYFVTVFLKYVHNCKRKFHNTYNSSYCANKKEGYVSDNTTRESYPFRLNLPHKQQAANKFHPNVCTRRRVLYTLTKPLLVLFVRSYREIDVITSKACIDLLITQAIASRNDIMTVDRTQRGIIRRETCVTDQIQQYNCNQLIQQCIIAAV